MKFSPDKYHYIVAGNKVIALSTYAGKPVRGIAKCNPMDEFDIEEGKRIAAARCNEKVAKRRLARAVKMYDEAYDNVKKAKQWEHKMECYYLDAYKAYSEAAKQLENI